MSSTTEPIEDAVEVSSRRPLVIALLVLGLVLVAAVWWLLILPMIGSDDEVPTGLVPQASSQTSPVSSGNVTPEIVDEDDATTDLVTYEMVLNRDPFSAVVPKPVTTETPGVGTTGDGPPSDLLPGSPDVQDIDGDGTNLPDGTDPGTDPSGGGPPVPGDGGTVPPPPVEPVGCTSAEDGAVCDGRSLSLIKISEVADGRRVAIIQVGSTIHEVEKGEVFAATFRLLSLGQDHVTVSFGDDVVELRQGERVLK